MQGKNKKLMNAQKYKMPESFHVEIDRGALGLTVCVSGVISICELSNASCVLKVRRGRIGIRGTGITVSVFEGGTVKVFGKISEVTLL